MRKRLEQFNDRLARLFPPKQLPGGEKDMARTVTFAVTDACSLRCTYCYQGVKSNHVLSFETAKKFTDSCVVPIPGSKNQERILENLRASEVDLTDAEFQELENGLANLKVYGRRKDVNMGSEYID